MNLTFAMITRPEFLNPNRLWALVVLPALIILYVYLLRRKDRVGMRYTNTGVLGAVLPKQARWRRHLAVAMSLASLVALVVAWARPLGIEKVPRERATVILVMDVSQSMASTDVKPSRLEAEKQAANRFINNLPPGYNLGIVKLSGRPAILLPPSTDRGVAHRVIDNLELEDGTALGDSLEKALKAIENAPMDEGQEEPAPALIILLSDGKSTKSTVSVDQVIDQAKDQNVPIHTIAFGTQNGYVDLDGKRERVPPDIDTLKRIATETGGEAKEARDADQLNNVYKSLESKVGYEEVKKEVTATYAWYALAFAIIAALGAVMMAARWP